MLITICDACSDQRSRAFSTDKVFFAILSCSCLLVTAVIHAAEVGTFALKAHVVRAFEHRKALQIVEKAIGRVLQTWTRVQTFKLRSLERFLLNYNFNLADSFEVLS